MAPQLHTAVPGGGQERRGGDYTPSEFAFLERVGLIVRGLSKGESLSIPSLPLSFWSPGSDYCILEDYWGRQTLACGELERSIIR